MALDTMRQTNVLLLLGLGEEWRYIQSIIRLIQLIWKLLSVKVKKQRCHEKVKFGFSSAVTLDLSPVANVPHFSVSCLVYGLQRELTVTNIDWNVLQRIIFRQR